MLTDELSARLEALADEQPFVPDLAPVLARARRARRRRRITGATVAAAIVVTVAAAVIAVMVSPRSAMTLSPGPSRPSTPPAVSFRAVAVTSPFPDTCVDMTFTETSQTVRVGCRQDSWAFPSHEHMTAAGFAFVSIRANSAPTWIAYGEVASADAAVTAQLNTGQRYRAIVIKPPLGPPYYPVYLVDLGPNAHIGAGANWIKTLTYSDGQRRNTVHNPPFATPSPTP